MRAVFGLVGLVIVMAIVLINARNSTASLKTMPQPAASVAGPVGASPQAQTEAIRGQVQGLVDQAAQAASEAAAP